MRCPEIEVLIAYGARKIEAEKTTELDQHLANCSACREVAAAQREVWSALDAWEMPPV